MADIELVIKLDEEDYEIMKHNIAVNNPLCPLSQEEMVSKVANGIPLPRVFHFQKGHGRLIEQEPVLEKIRAEIERQEKWLLQAGCNTYNVDIALDAIKSVVAGSEG